MPTSTGSTASTGAPFEQAPIKPSRITSPAAISIRFIHSSYPQFFVEKPERLIIRRSIRMPWGERYVPRLRFCSGIPKRWRAEIGYPLIMRIGETWYRTIWLADDGRSVDVIDQRALPFSFEIMRLGDGGAGGPRHQRDGGPGRTADRRDRRLRGLSRARRRTRCTAPSIALSNSWRRPDPTAVNLRWALDVMDETVRFLPVEERVAAAYQRAARICDDDVEISKSIGRARARHLPRAGCRQGIGAAQYSDSLQRRLARHRRLGHSARTDLHGPRRGARCPRLGR